MLGNHKGFAKKCKVSGLPAVERADGTRLKEEQKVDRDR